MVIIASPLHRALFAIIITSAALVFYLSGAGHAADVRAGHLEIETATGRQVITVELVATEKQRALGLQWRRKLAPDAGMLFDFQEVRHAIMWMKNTFIPLDMVFIASDGRIVNIAEHTVPHSLARIYSDRPVRAVLELNAGSAARLGIKPNDRVIHKIFGNLEN
jgi:uncharacterized membrane protein (UPF0127 family)